MSTFISVFVQDVVGRTQSPTAGQQQQQSFASGAGSERKQKLRDALLGLNPPTAEQSILAALLLLRDAAAPSDDPEEESLKQAVLGRVVLGVYAGALNAYLDQATEAEREAAWWDNIERSRYELAWYLLQTLPVRILDLFRTVANALQQHDIPVTLSSLNPASIRQMFPTSVDSLHYNALTKAMFPHLNRYPLTSFSITPILRWHHVILSTVTLPIEFTRQECRLKRKELERIRDERAEALGSLSEMRLSLQDNFDTNTKRSRDTADLGIERYSPLIDTLQRKLDGKPAQLGIRPGSVERLLDLSTRILPGHRKKNLSIFAEDKLKRPSNLVLAWPKLLLSPPFILYGFKLLYTSRASLREVAKDAWNTLMGLWRGWLIDPLKDVLKTVRAGGEGSIIVQREAVAADLASLERMTLSLAKDKLHYSSSQLKSLSNAVQQGDLTPILRIYEEDIRTPVKSAIAGTLLRSLFIQVQKAKVDIDQALSGIDKLLKSQELTFAFVGVAPVIAITYAVGGLFARIWEGGRGIGKHGGRHRRTIAWLVMRRIERLLIFQPHSHHHTDGTATPQLNSGDSLPPLTSGLLLLSVTQLRYYGETSLPPSSRIREGFLEDVKDLEDPRLGRNEKLRVLDRMWKSWGTTLGWGAQ
ncbi:NCA2-domain-containing protein [Thelephora ganbajun]|uniref:NCA2-domain-containing protein n=1 Tax=Thelephora ganbajun TaxID=370292 RepID=A0ACB6ZP64_THEGA|nr:NCA2-domain-containing protein [Thelephora ganbajun]